MTKMKKICSVLAISVMAVLLLAGFSTSRQAKEDTESRKLAEAYTIGYYAGVDSTFVENIGNQYSSVTQEDLLSYQIAKKSFEENQSWDNAIELYNAIERIMDKVEQEK